MAEPEAPAPRRRLPDVARIAGGVVLVGVVVGAGLLVERATDDDLSLPEELAGMPVDDSAEAREVARTHRDGLAGAHDGADAVAALYETDGAQVLVTAVRARSGPPVPELVTGEHEWVERDDVQCLVTRPDEGPATALCQRGDGDLTVRVLAAADGDVADGVDGVVAVTNEVWEELG